MRNSYIANTHEAAALHSGKQTAIVVKMKFQTEEGFHIHKGVGWDGKEYFEERNGTLYIIPRLMPPYTLGQEVYVREAWGRFYALDENENVITSAKITVLESEWSDKTDEWAWADMNKNIIDRDDNPPIWQSPATMPQSAARTRFKVVGVEAVRVQSILGNSELLYPLTCGADGIECGKRLYKLATSKFGQQAWDNNDFIWYFKIEKI